jgi:apolipoprotein N-acyltransferase
MKEDLSKSRTDLRPVEVLPSIDEHEDKVRRIFKTCISVAAGVFVVAVGSIWIALRNGVPLSVLASVVPIVMAILIGVFAIGYAIPVGLVSLLRLGFTIKMGHESLRMTRTIADRVRRDTAPLPVNHRATTED